MTASLEPQQAESRREDAVDGADSLFAYGTLRDWQVQQVVCGRNFASVPARLHGWRLVDEPDFYPRIELDLRSSAEGELLRGLTPGDWESLDCYETAAYRRSLMEVELADGSRCWAWAYIPLRRLRRPR